MIVRATYWPQPGAKPQVSWFATVEDAWGWAQEQAPGVSDSELTRRVELSQLPNARVIEILREGYPPSPPLGDDPVAKRLGIVPADD